MIINELYNYYNRLTKRPDLGIPVRGYSVARVSFAFNISLHGDLLDVIVLADQKGKRLVPTDMIVPEQPVRSGKGVTPGFLCDNSMYVIGDDDKGNPERSRLAFEASRKLHLDILRHIDDDGARAICNYYQKWNPDKARLNPRLVGVVTELIKGGNIVFMLDGQEGFIHDREAVKSAWLKHYREESSEVVGQCLVTGETAPIARIHPKIKGVTGAQPTGASIVSFNLSAFTSYGKDQNFNAPISEDVAFGYTTVLNHMLAGSRQRVQLDPNTTVVFWSERFDGSREEGLIAQLFGFQGPNSSADGSSDSREPVDDLETTTLVRHVLERVRRGQVIDFDAIQMDPEARFFVLGLSPNSSRISVRFWQADTFGSLVTKVAQHHADLSLIAPKNRDSPLISVSEILKETAIKDAADRIPPLLGGGLMRSVLTGAPYPLGLYTAMISRIRADREINYVRVAVIKACLVRRIRFGVVRGDLFRTQSFQEVALTMSLDEHNTNPAYRLGRLFAVLEKVQQDANPGINTSIRDRYFGAASATPRAVFPQLLRLTQHHISKAEYGLVSDKLIETIISGLDEFPSHLNLGDQGLFMLGYYHQRQAFYQKSTKGEGK